MKSSSMWLGIFVGSLLILSAVVVCTLIPSGSNQAMAAGDEVDLEKLSKAYGDYVQAGNKDLNGFEKRVNQKDIYYGKDHVRVTMTDKGSVVGYVDSDKTPGYQPADKMVFTIEADQESKQIVSRDRNQRHYGYRSNGLMTGLLVGHMLGGQRRYGSSYRAPSSAKWVQSGYHSRVRSSSKSFRSGSSGTRRSGSGGFGSGK